MAITYFTINYLVDNFFENVDEHNPKFDRPLLQLLQFLYVG